MLQSSAFLPSIGHAVPCCHHTSRASLLAGAADVFLHGLPLLVEEDRGHTALRSAETCPFALPFVDSNLPDTQQAQQDVYQLYTTPPAPMQMDATADTCPPTGPKIPDQLPPATTAAVSQATSAQPAQQAQQRLPTELAQHASAAAAAVPSSLHWGLFSAQATMQGNLQSPHALPPSASLHQQQYQPEACEEMPEKAVPDYITWMQLYSAAGIHHGQGHFGQFPGQGHLAQPRACAVCAEAGALPPALAQQDPNTGQWVFNLMPLNPFMIEQLAKTHESPTRLTGQPQPSPEGVRVTAYPNGSRAVASKKWSRASQQLPLSGESDAPIPARAFPAVDWPVLDRMYEETPAQLATSPSLPDCTAAASRTAVSNIHEHHAVSNAQEWHSLAQANGSMSSSFTCAGPNLTPPNLSAPGDVIDLCSPTASWQARCQQNGSDPGLLETAARTRLRETAARSRLWHGSKQPSAGPGAAPQQPTSWLHKELTEFAVMASTTQVGLSKDVPIYCISSRRT